MYCTMFCNLECILEANDSDLLTHLLSYPHSRDAIASKNKTRYVSTRYLYISISCNSRKDIFGVVLAEFISNIENLRPVMEAFKKKYGIFNALQNPSTPQT